MPVRLDQATKQRSTPSSDPAWYGRTARDPAYYVARIFHIAYLDVLTRHHWYTTNGPKFSRVHLRLENTATGATRASHYPEPK